MSLVHFTGSGVSFNHSLDPELASKQTKIQVHTLRDRRGTPLATGHIPNDLITQVQRHHHVYSLCVSVRELSFPKIY